MAIVADVPARPDGLELIGEMTGSGYRTPPSFVRRNDGQTLQLTPLLYAVLEAVDGRRDHAEIARVVSARTGRAIGASDIEALLEQQLRPRGLVLGADGTTPSLQRTNPLTGLRFKLAVTDPALTRRLTAPFAALFHWWIWIPLLIAFGWVAWWLLMDRGLASATYQAFAKPELLALVLGVTILSAGFHEFGHAAAARRGGAQPGVMGAGLYLVWPAFYTDVTDTYRLRRSGRLRTDLGGLYFNAIVAVAITAIWWFSGWDALLLVVAAQIVQMVRQLAPMVRFDGYHVLADLTGVPDLFSRIWPIIASLWPTRWGDPRVSQLKWWARLVVTAWVLIVMPLLAFTLLALVLAAPRLIGTAWENLQRQWEQATAHWSAGQFLDGAGTIPSMVAIALPVVAIGLILGRVSTRGMRSLWRRTAGRPFKRAGAGVLVLSLAAALAFAWWPSPERYEPVRPYEGGTLLNAVGAPLSAVGYDSADTDPVRGGEMRTVLPASETLPTEAEPQLALVLVPRGAETSGQPAWVFPFDEPLPPEAGDNQAFATNTTDDSVTYDVAIAMVWVTGDDPVLNVNEAYAFASCSDCVTVAVAFQVVLIVGSADVVIPQNLSAAVNYDCFECITAALASQLVVTVEALPGPRQQVALDALWEEIMAFADSIPTMSLADLIARLDDYKQQILEIVTLRLPATRIPDESPSPSATATPSASASEDAGTSATPQPITSPSSSSTAATPPATPIPTPTRSPTSTPTPAP